MRQFDCPQCGAPVVFQSATAEASVCAHCQSVVVRHDVNVEAIGQLAALPQDMSPLQIGAHGELDGLAFTLLGRTRVKWTDGSWSEWFVEYADHTRGWVGEAQGYFMVLRETALKTEIALRQDQFKADGKIQINGMSYRVTDAKPVSCLGGEGELPEAVVTGEKWESIDLDRSDGCVATLEKTEDGWRFFEGKNASFVELNWQNLKPIPGWNGVPLVTERNQTGALNCPSCGGVVNLRAAGFTMTAVCSHCGKLLDTSTPQLTVVQKAAAARAIKPEIPLGQRGVIDGVEWEHIGFQCRRDSATGWTEYLLFNPCFGFRWLTEFQGHWTLVDRLLKAPLGCGMDMKYEGRSYRLFADENCEVNYVEGEFYWQVRRGEKARCADYIAPPYILSREIYHELNEVSWSAGEYIEASKIQQAFKLPSLKSPASGSVGIVQPNPRLEKWRSLKPLMLIFVTALVAVAIFSSSSRKVVRSYENTFVYDRATAAATPLVSEPFVIQSVGGVDISATAAVNNSWLGFDFELVNQQSGERFPASLTVEFYYGTDSDGSWTEGSQTGSASVPGVSAGTYTLAMSAEADPSITQLPFNISVRSGKTYSSNFIISILLVLIWPIIMRLRAFGFEVKRWSNSDFSPYASKSSSSSDDD